MTEVVDNDDRWHDLYIAKDGLRAVVFGQTQQQLLHNLIMFETTAMADRLCALNSWDRRSLHVHALELGIKYAACWLLG